MDNKYQDIHIINVLTGKKNFLMRMVYVTSIHFTEKDILISYATPTTIETRTFPKQWNKLVID